MPTKIQKCWVKVACFCLISQLKLSSWSKRMGKVFGKCLPVGWNRAHSHRPQPRSLLQKWSLCSSCPCMALGLSSELSVTLFSSQGNQETWMLVWAQQVPGALREDARHFLWQIHALKLCRNTWSWLSRHTFWENSNFNKHNRDTSIANTVSRCLYVQCSFLMFIPWYSWKTFPLCF